MCVEGGPKFMDDQHSLRFGVSRRFHPRLLNDGVEPATPL
jgi:hypothetical protein